MSAAVTRVRSAARILLGSTAAAVTDLTQADASLRAGLPLSRRVGVVALAGGSGTTSTVASLASLLARRRTGMVLGVDAAGGVIGLRHQTAAQVSEARGQTVEAADARRRSARTAADARAGLPSSSSGLHLLDVTGPDRSAAPVAAWGGAVGPIARFFDLVVTDWGVRSTSAELQEVAATSHILMVVARADRRAANTAAAGLVTLGESAGGPRTVLTLVDVARTPDRMAAGLQQALGCPVLWLPYEEERSRTTTPTSRRFSSRTRSALIRSAVTVMDEAVASQAPALLLRSEPGPLTSTAARG